MKRIFIAVAVFVVIYFGGSYGLVYSGLVEVRVIPLELLPKSIWDIGSYLSIAGWSMAESWWVWGVFALALIIAFLVGKYGFRSKPRRG